MLANIPRLMTAYYTRAARSCRPRAARGVRHVGPSRVRVQHRLQRGAHPRHHAGHLRVPPAAADRRAAVPRHRHARAVGAGLRERARGAGGQRRRRDDRRPRRVHADARHLARDPRLQPRAARAAWPTASSSRRRTIRPRTAASSTTRRTAGRPTRTSPAGSRSGRMRCSPTGCAAVKRIPFERARRAPTTHRHDYIDAYVGDLASVVDMDVMRGAKLDARRRSARRRRRALLGRDRRALSDCRSRSSTTSSIRRSAS